MEPNKYCVQKAFVQYVFLIPRFDYHKLEILTYFFSHFDKNNVNVESWLLLSKYYCKNALRETT